MVARGPGSVRGGDGLGRAGVGAWAGGGGPGPGVGAGRGRTRARGHGPSSRRCGGLRRRSLNMQNDAGEFVDLYVPRKW